jgi:hypothetical protein
MTKGYRDDVAGKRFTFSKDLSWIWSVGVGSLFCATAQDQPLFDNREAAISSIISKVSTMFSVSRSTFRLATRVHALRR